MNPLGTYSFLPWLRQGLANQIVSADFDDAVHLRAQVNVALDVSGDKVDGGGTLTATIARPVALFGPGDIVGIDRRAIVRVEPRNWITNFEPNYLAHIEFYDEDFPWRYTPAMPDGATGRLRPWLTLLVLTEEEFKDGKQIKDKPLPYIDVLDLNVFPRADELWAWAHVHVNRSLGPNDEERMSSDMGAVIPALEAVLKENPDLAYSRLVCPRKLAENMAYHAFLIPTFETGRQAGLGLEIEDIAATKSAWDPGARPLGQSFPYYHRWFFRTGAAGDFESLVRLLKPKPVDPRVGTREMDVQFPGSNVSGIDKPELNGILKLGGALRPPSPVPPQPPNKYETWDVPFPRPLQEDLAALLNLPDDYQRAGDPDPIVAPPIYGTWHAFAKRVLTNADGTPITLNQNWIHRLNLDPRFRVAAGFGTRVIQDQQEKFMDAAWEQIGKVLEAQRRIRLGQFAVQVSQIWYDRHLMPLLGVSPQKTLLLMAPVNKRMLTNVTASVTPLSGAATLAGATSAAAATNAASAATSPAKITVHHALAESPLQPTMTSAALRRIVRPRGRLVRSLPFDALRRPDQLLARVNAGEVSAAPPKVAPPGVLTFDQMADLAQPRDLPSDLLDWLRRIPQLPWLILLIAAIVAVLLFLFLPAAIAAMFAATIVGVAVFLRNTLARAADDMAAADVIRESSQTPEWVDSLPGAAGFVITAVGSPAVTPQSGPDSVEASRFKVAMRDTFTFMQASKKAGALPLRHALDLTLVATDALKTLKPSQTIPRRIRAGLFVPPRLLAEMGEDFVEPMAYPVIDLAMYEPLKNLSAELFLPNINLIEPNSVTLLETNQRFIESYMVGLNHEFARELLWREYPTDQRGSTFRQFWDVRGFFNADNKDDEALKEELRDIPPLHVWPSSSPLGSHDNREQGAEDEEELVLVIRGELLKRYPTAVIYAHRACWQRKDDGTEADLAKDPCFRSGAIDNKQERRLVPLTPEEELNPPRTKVLTPLYEAKVDPDIYFFGFDLTVDVAKGGTGADPTDDPGWFFVIRERPGEPRFGLDAEQQTHRNVWNDLSWPEVQPGPSGSFIEIGSAPASFPLATPGTAEQEKSEQHEDDLQIAWSHGMSSAELAYILFQAPVLVGVHASEMLPK